MGKDNIVSAIRNHGNDEEIFRYMSLSKFISILDRSAIPLIHTSLLNDSHEGIWPQKVFNEVVEGLTSAFEGLKVPDISTTKVAHLIKQVILITRKHTYITSWNRDKKESYAMWKVYLESNEGIAIQTTKKKLKKYLRAFGKERLIPTNYREVRYENMEEAEKPFEDVRDFFLLKRPFFEYENEVRGIALDVQTLPLEEDSFALYDFIMNTGPKLMELHENTKRDNLQKVIHFNVDLMDFIESVYVSPFAEPWFSETVKSLLLKYNLQSIEVKDSGIINTSYLDDIQL